MFTLNFVECYKKDHEKDGEDCKCTCENGYSQCKGRCVKGNIYYCFTEFAITKDFFVVDCVNGEVRKDCSCVCDEERGYKKCKNGCQLSST